MFAKWSPSRTSKSSQSLPSGRSMQKSRPYQSLTNMPHTIVDETGPGTATIFPARSSKVS